MTNDSMTAAPMTAFTMSQALLVTSSEYEQTSIFRTNWKETRLIHRQDGGRMDGKRSASRPRKRWTDNITEWTGHKWTLSKDMCQNRKKRKHLRGLLWSSYQQGGIKVSKQSNFAVSTIQALHFSCRPHGGQLSSIHVLSWCHSPLT